MIVTINTDASFNCTLKIGTYAFWAVCDSGRVKKSGVLKNKCINPDDAEARCIVNALATVLLNNENIKRVIVNTDSLNAIAILKNDIRHIKKYMGGTKHKWGHIKTAYSKVLDVTKNRTSVEFRHVKAHTGISDKRSFVNEWCDNEAKKQLRKEVINFK